MVLRKRESRSLPGVPRLCWKDNPLDHVLSIHRQFDALCSSHGRKVQRGLAFRRMLDEDKCGWPAFCPARREIALYSGQANGARCFRELDASELRCRGAVRLRACRDHFQDVSAVDAIACTMVPNCRTASNLLFSHTSVASRPPLAPDAKPNSALAESAPTAASAIGKVSYGSRVKLRDR